MRRLQVAVLAVGAVVFAICLITAAAACPGLRCGSRGAGGPWTWVTAVLLVLAFLSAATLARAGWLAKRGQRSLAALPPAEGPDAAAARLRLGGRALLTGGSGVAFCTGLLQPRLYLSADVVAVLNHDELEAVLIHERCHAARRDPLRRVARRAVADVLWFAPAVAWWAERRVQLEEVAADAVAVRSVGERPVAGALLKLWAGSARAPAQAAYNDAASARVASLLGDPVVRERVPSRLWLLSAMGVLASIPLGICVATLIV